MYLHTTEGRESHHGGGEQRELRGLLNEVLVMQRNASHTMIDSLEPRRMMAADLVISTIEMQPQVLTQAQDTNAVLHITNQGSATVQPGVTVRFAFSRDGVWGNNDDIFLGNRTIGQSIRPGETVQLPFTGRLGGQPQGVFRLGAYVDSRGVVAESKERNNSAVSAPDTVTYYYPMADNTTWGKVGTNGDDRVTISNRADMAIVTVNDRVYARPMAGLTKLTFDAGPGNDVIIASPDFPIDLAITGSGGDDVIIGGAGNDELSGANGRDRLFGGKGDDLLLGGGSNDRLYGEDGNDTLSGNRGHDMLFGGAGSNEIWGGDHNDRIFTRGNNAVDRVYGGLGHDTAEVDPDDLVLDVEVRA